MKGVYADFPVDDKHPWVSTRLFAPYDKYEHPIVVALPEGADNSVLVLALSPDAISYDKDELEDIPVPEYFKYKYFKVGIYKVLVL